jgi:hypothetical protein
VNRGQEKRRAPLGGMCRCEQAKDLAVVGSSITDLCVAVRTIPSGITSE